MVNYDPDGIRTSLKMVLAPLKLKAVILGVQFDLTRNDNNALVLNNVWSMTGTDSFGMRSAAHPPVP